MRDQHPEPPYLSATAWLSAVQLSKLLFRLGLEADDTAGELNLDRAVFVPGLKASQVDECVSMGTARCRFRRRKIV